MNKPKKISNLRKKSETTEFSVVSATPSSATTPVVDYTVPINLPYPGRLLILGCIELEPDEFHYLVSDECNRELVEENVNQLINDRNVTKNPTDYPFTEPVVAFWDKNQEKLILKDGQHRARACEVLGTKLRYCLVEEDYSIFNGKASQEMKWDTDELIPSLAKANIEPYVLLEELHRRHSKYPYSTLAIFFNLEMVKSEILRRQEFTISDNYKTSKLNSSGKMTALEVAELRLSMYEKFNEVADRNDRSKEIILCLVKAFEHRDFDFDYFLKRTEKNRDAAANIPEMSQSISTQVRARHLLRFYHNANSKLNHFYF